MFGLDLTELILLLIVGIVVVGPKKLPEMMRTTGRWIAKLRRMSSDLRTQSGIDAILKAEGLEKEIRELRSLSRINVMDSLVNATTRAPVRALPVRATTAGGASAPLASSDGPAPGPRAAGAASSSVEPPPAEVATTVPSTGAPPGTPPIVPPGAPPPGAIAASPPGVVSRAVTSAAAATAMVLPGEEPLADREYPPWGCDAYDALPDDLDEKEEAAIPAPVAGDVASADPAMAEPAPAAPTPAPARQIEPGAA